MGLQTGLYGIIRKLNRRRLDQKQKGKSWKRRNKRAEQNRRKAGDKEKENEGISWKEKWRTGRKDLVGFKGIQVSDGFGKAVKKEIKFLK